MFVYAIYPDEQSAAKALRGLVDAGFPANAVSGLMHREEGAEAPRRDTKTRASRGELLGAVLQASGGHELTPAGNFLAAGTLFAALQGGTGFGAISALEFWPEEADSLRRHLADGDVIIAVETVPEHRATAERALQAAQAKEIAASRSLGSAVGEN